MTCTQVIARITGFIEGLSERIGQITSWLVVGLVLLTLFDVTMRYLFNNGSVALQELEWHLFGIIILFGASYTLKYDEHVRVDVLYASERLSDRHRSIIDLLGHLLLCLPFAILICWASFPFAEDAFSRMEISPDPGGLGHRWLLKAAIPLGFGLVALQALAKSYQILNKLRKSG